ncbi:myo-inositol 2-dehydrogenase [Aliidongia dinghuensis]|uniref:Myo-inositol 2-dehydrogenase n=1 Tax=Aliidongia dinghuensis TaxID=1867774 RepID=A0A8J2Z1R2_9PROT|nr:Gfo/Idh/MocA family oxidoreductase [Aliidongia dinghuensis]GGF51018.1 myo-inositol 2-dehydrogenase [Aliidongia dinghuensis]
MDTIGIGLIGTGFMGKCHALAFNAVKAAFEDAVPRPELRMLCDVDAARARHCAQAFGFAASTTDWRRVVEDPAVDLVSITVPNGLHREIAVAALEAGKHVYCEKPMALTLEDAEAMAAAARRAAGRTIVGYNYVRNPAIAHARHLVEAGALGRILHFRGIVDEDYMADPALPWSWRCRRAEAGLGTLGDITVHLLSMAHLLVGPVVRLAAAVETVHRERPVPGGGMAEVENDDLAHALVKFESGVSGVLASSRVAWGRKNRLAWEIHGSRGTLVFDQERMNELQLFEAAGEPATRGFRTILTGPLHPPFDRFCPAAGHGLGFNDLKVIEAAEFLRAIAAGTRPRFDFEEALAIERVIDGFARSAAAGAWVDVP